ncbi:MAG: diacylglycerol/polyprenol kinase family protein [candidate division WOR-3 bacterium]
MKTLTKFVILRKLLHIGTALFPICYIFVPRFKMIVALAIVSFITLLVDFLRLEVKKLNKIFNRYFGKLLWEKEKKTLTAGTHYVAGAFLSIYFFDKWIAIAVLLFLSFGDTLAHIIGVKWGKIRLDSEKTVEGSVACFVVCLFVSIFLPHPNKLVLFLGSIVASLVEFFPFGIDDNFALPLITGVAMEIILKIL